MMYEELVKRLKHTASLYFALPTDGGDLSLTRLLSEAADSIEELSREYESVAESMNESVELVRKLQSPRWVSVTERLPEKRKYVLVRYKNNDMAVACWFDGDEDLLFWRAITDEGWCSDCDTDPTHWQPLPEPPEEVLSGTKE